ncbi:MAG: helix-turn-helix domain-containing protein [Rhodospirillaceae bacterium]
MPTATNKKSESKGCPMDSVLRVLWKEWTTHILWTLSTEGPTRFNHLNRLVEGISPKVLTDRLRQMEADGLIWREHVASIPPAVTYGLTEKGKDFDSVLKAFEAVAVKWGDGQRG